MIRRLMAVLALLLVLTAPALAQDQTESDFTILLSALEAADLTGTLADGGPYTIFAPTDEAFALTLESVGISADDLLADTVLLNDILLYHVLDGAFTAEDVVLLIQESGGVAEVETLGGDTLTIELMEGLPVVNGDAIVVLPDVEASNGVIHVVDTVLLPPDVTIGGGEEMAAAGDDMAATEEAMVTEEAVPTAPGEQTIVAVASGTPELSTLVTAIETVGLAEILSEEGPYTVFAPTNEAFEFALADLGLTLEQLLADTDLLTTILTYHVVDGTLPAQDLEATVQEAGGVAELDTVSGEPLTMEFVDGVPVFNFIGTSVTTPNVPASNGVIHIIDGVLLPPSMGS